MNLSKPQAAQDQFEQQDEEYKVCRQCNQQQRKNKYFIKSQVKSWPICNQCFNPQIQMIIQGLYLGNEDAAADLSTIQKYQINAICVCGSFLMAPFKGKKMKGKFETIQYVAYNIGDFYDEKISHLFDGNSQWISEKIAEGRNVLVHCAGGVSRSASFVIAYLIKKKKMTYPEAIQFVKERRKAINPNSGFRNQLEAYDKNSIQQKRKCLSQSVEACTKLY